MKSNFGKKSNRFLKCLALATSKLSSHGLLPAVDFSFRFVFVLIEAELFLFNVFDEHVLFFDPHFGKGKGVVPIPYGRQDVHIHMVFDSAFWQKSRDDEPVNVPHVFLAHVAALVRWNFGSFLVHLGPVSPVSNETDIMPGFIFDYGQYTTPLILKI